MQCQTSKYFLKWFYNLKVLFPNFFAYKCDDWVLKFDYKWYLIRFNYTLKLVQQKFSIILSLWLAVA